MFDTAPEQLSVVPAQEVTDMGHDSPLLLCTCFLYTLLLEEESGRKGFGGASNSLIVGSKKMAEVFLVCTEFRPYFLADRPISSFIEVHLARPSTKTTQNGPFI